MRVCTLFAVAGLWSTIQPASAQDAAPAADVSSSAGTPAQEPDTSSHDQRLDRGQVAAYPERGGFRASVDAHVGLAGLGGEASLQLPHRLDLRLGSDFFSYSTVVTSDDTPVNADLRLRSSQVAVDWYPTHRSFHVSPLLVFANSTHIGTEVDLNQGQSISLNGVNYYSYTLDPLQGSAKADLRRVSPGVTVGFGRVIPRRGHRFSFPTELGFFYAGTTDVKVQFTGTACDATGDCEPVQSDPSFQYNLAQFKAKYQNYANDLKLFPILSTGIAFAF